MPVGKLLRRERTRISARQNSKQAHRLARLTAKESPRGKPLLRTNYDPAQVPVLIVGAGPTGLTLACDLARRGHPPPHHRQSPAYFAGSGGKGLQPRTLELLDNLGLIDGYIGLIANTVIPSQVKDYLRKCTRK